MFKRQVKSLEELLGACLSENGLETPLLEKRLIDAWEQVTGKTVSQYTGDRFIKDQTLHVKITNPALRQDLTMMRSQLVKRLNETVGAVIITNIRIY